MPYLTRFDLSCESLDLYFVDQFPHLTPEAKDALPKDVIFKLFRKGGAFNSNSTSKLGFLAKLYILWRALNKRFWIVIEDEDRGMTPGQFMELRKAAKERDYSQDQAKTIILSGTLVIGNKELGDSLQYLNDLSAAPSYNYLIKAKNSPKNKVAKATEEREYIIKFLTYWESNKKTIVSQTGLNIPEIYVLMTLFSGKEVPSSSIYQQTFKRAYQSSPTKIKTAFGTLQQRGYVQKYGVSKKAILKITSLGKDVLIGIINKYAVNC